jgi:radical SAM/Cys-rich protein
MLDTLPKLQKIAFPPLQRDDLKVLQVNLGYRCNQQCAHCHVAAGPKRTEVMSTATVDAVIDAMHRLPVKTVDLTGGAPELNPEFRRLVEVARTRDLHIIDRCNLSVLMEEGQESLAQFLADNEVEVVASLPCYLEQNVDAQRGNGTFEKSIAGLQELNMLGYGQEGSGLVLKLVYNPQGASLPPDQSMLETDYKRILFEKYGIRFSALLTLANLPVRRFGSALLSRGEFHDYMTLLQENHRPCNLDAVMCRSLVSIDWQGYVYDCDFNQMLGLPIGYSGRKTHITELNEQSLQGSPITVAGHCYGCTAGSGSSCGGALSA